jgi:hypothetical protein
MLVINIAMTINTIINMTKPKEIKQKKKRKKATIIMVIVMVTVTHMVATDTATKT